MNQDLQHLKLLSIFHYVLGGLAALFSCLPVIYVVIGLVLIISPEAMGPQGNQPPPAFLGWLMVFVGGMFILVGWTVAALILATGRFLGNQTHYVFCLVIAAIECLSMPFGTVLGVFTIVVLMRESVKGLFLTGPGSCPFAEPQ